MDTSGLSSIVTAHVESGGDASLLRSVRVRYRLPVAPETARKVIGRVFDFHARHCGIYRSLHPQIEITTELELLEA